MRNTTKLKQILLLFDLYITMSEDEEITFKLIHKSTGRGQMFTDTSYSKLMAKAFSYMNKSLKSL